LGVALATGGEMPGKVKEEKVEVLKINADWLRMRRS